VIACKRTLCGAHDLQGLRLQTTEEDCLRARDQKGAIRLNHLLVISRPVVHPKALFGTTTFVPHLDKRHRHHAPCPPLVGSPEPEVRPIHVFINELDC
jgi:hypothetical protein